MPYQLRSSTAAARINLIRVAVLRKGRCTVVYMTPKPPPKPKKSVPLLIGPLRRSARIAAMEQKKTSSVSSVRVTRSKSFVIEIK